MGYLCQKFLKFIYVYFLTGRYGYRVIIIFIELRVGGDVINQVAFVLSEYYLLVL